jgi:hypothetical protein
MRQAQQNDSIVAREIRRSKTDDGRNGLLASPEPYRGLRPRTRTKEVFA